MFTVLIEGVLAFRIKGEMAYITATAKDGDVQPICQPLEDFLASHVAASEVIAKWRLKQLGAEARPAIPIGRGKRRR